MVVPGRNGHGILGVGWCKRWFSAWCYWW